MNGGWRPSRPNWRRVPPAPKGTWQLVPTLCTASARRRGLTALVEELQRAAQDDARRLAALQDALVRARAES
jgi:hypothetical protein